MRNFCSRQRGFTLIELMAVVVIIGIAIGLVTLSIGDGTRSYQVKNAVRELYSSIGLAAEEAVYRRRQYGLRFDIDNNAETLRYSYEWLQYDAEKKQWLEVQTPELAQKVLPENMTLMVEVEKQQLSIGRREQDDAPLFAVQKSKELFTQPLQPDIYFFSSGEMQNFTLTLSAEENPDGKYTITGNMLGQLKLQQAGDDEG